MKPLPALALALLSFGCDNFQAQHKPEPASAPAPANSRFAIYSSAGETFLVNSETGKVWRYDAKEKTFLEVPVTTKIIRYDSKGNVVQPDPDNPLGLTPPGYDSKGNRVEPTPKLKNPYE
jgi:hypothetical protein